MAAESLAGPRVAWARRLRNLHRITYVDVVLLLLRLAVIVVVVGGTIGTLLKGTYTSAQ
jgi:branched-chain amino acid transport system permease protein